jgi:hypothetical protein
MKIFVLEMAVTALGFTSHVKVKRKRSRKQ